MSESSPSERTHALLSLALDADKLRRRYETDGGDVRSLFVAFVAAVAERDGSIAGDCLNALNDAIDPHTP